MLRTSPRAYFVEALYPFSPASRSGEIILPREGETHIPPFSQDELDENSETLPRRGKTFSISPLSQNHRNEMLKLIEQNPPLFHAGKPVSYEEIATIIDNAIRLHLTTPWSMYAVQHKGNIIGYFKLDPDPEKSLLHFHAFAKKELPFTNLWKWVADGLLWSMYQYNKSLEMPLSKSTKIRTLATPLQLQSLLKSGFRRLPSGKDYPVPCEISMHTILGIPRERNDSPH